MHTTDFIQLALFLIALIALTPLLGGFMARVFSGEAHPFTKPLSWLERLIYRRDRKSTRLNSSHG